MIKIKTQIEPKLKLVNKTVYKQNRYHVTDNSSGRPKPQTDIMQWKNQSRRHIPKLICIKITEILHTIPYYYSTKVHNGVSINLRDEHYTCYLTFVNCPCQIAVLTICCDTALNAEHWS